MVCENVSVYRILTGEDMFPQSGSFTICKAGEVTLDGAGGNGVAPAGEVPCSGAAMMHERRVVSSRVDGINPGDWLGLGDECIVTGSDGFRGRVCIIAVKGPGRQGALILADALLDPDVTYCMDAVGSGHPAACDDPVPCFTRGTRIMTLRGEVPIEALREGDRVFTRDNGYQPLRWIGRKTVQAQGALAPVVFAPGTMGNEVALEVSPYHRMLVEERLGHMLFGERELLISAIHMTRRAGVSRRKGGLVQYFHILFDQHEIVFGNGIMSESFFPEHQALATLTRHGRAEVLDLFPDLQERDMSGFAQTARTCLSQGEALMLERYCA